MSDLRGPSDRRPKRRGGSGEHGGGADWD